MLIFLDPYYIESRHVIAVRPSGLDSGHTCLWCIGQDADHGGFLVKMRCEDVIVELDEAGGEVYPNTPERLLAEVDAEIESSRKRAKLKGAVSGATVRA